MDLLNKVKTELEKKGYDFSSEFWTDEELTILYDVVYATEKVINGQEQPPKKAPTTYRECLESLPDGYRELALKNAEGHGIGCFINNELCLEIYKAIGSCIIWSKTPQGLEFWKAVHDHYEKGTDLPELPNNE